MTIEIDNIVMDHIKRKLSFDVTVDSPVWRTTEEKPHTVGCMCALRVETVSGENVAHQVVIGYALDDKFSFASLPEFQGVDSIEVTHWMMLPLIPGLDRYFRELTL